jgi:hypothetical protein
VERDAQEKTRDIVFISKATPEDDEFVLWLAPRLEAAGYAVFADILSLEPGDRWRKQVTGTLQDKAIKMLLCCRDATLEKNGVQEEVGIAEDLAKGLNDPRFIIPLRRERFRKVFGIGELQWVNFVGGWGRGLRDLINTLNDQNVPRATAATVRGPRSSISGASSPSHQHRKSNATSPKSGGLRSIPSTRYSSASKPAADRPIFARARLRIS